MWNHRPAASTNFRLRLAYKQTKVLSVYDAAYIAGLVDGEGTVTLTRKHRNENRQLAVSISSTELPMLRFVIECSGVGKITRKRTYRSNHLPSYAYAVYNRQALSLLRQITPALRSYKRQRAELILPQYEALTPRNGKYSSELSKQRAEFEAQVLAITARARAVEQQPPLKA